MKKKMDDLSGTEQMATLDMLYTAASSLKGRASMKSFLKGLLTPSERIMLGRRIWIARLLLTGYTPSEIGRMLKVGPNTVWRVEKWLHDQLPGYENAIEGMEKELKRREDIQDIKSNPFSYKALKKKYPLHFLLFPDPK